MTHILLTSGTNFTIYALVKYLHFFFSLSDHFILHIHIPFFFIKQLFHYFFFFSHFFLLASFQIFFFYTHCDIIRFTQFLHYFHSVAFCQSLLHNYYTSFPLIKLSSTLFLYRSVFITILLFNYFCRVGLEYLFIGLDINPK